MPRAVWSSEARCEGVGREKPQVGRVMVDFRGGEEPRYDTRIPRYVHAESSCSDGHGVFAVCGRKWTRGCMGTADPWKRA